MNTFVFASLSINYIEKTVSIKVINPNEVRNIIVNMFLYNKPPFPSIIQINFMMKCPKDAVRMHLSNVNSCLKRKATAPRTANCKNK